LLARESDDVEAAEAVAPFCYQVRNGASSSPRRSLEIAVIADVLPGQKADKIKQSLKNSAREHPHGGPQVRESQGPFSQRLEKLELRFPGYDAYVHRIYL